MADRLWILRKAKATQQQLAGGFTIAAAHRFATARQPQVECERLRPVWDTAAEAEVVHSKLSTSCEVDECASCAHAHTSLLNSRLQSCWRSEQIVSNAQVRE